MGSGWLTAGAGRLLRRLRRGRGAAPDLPGAPAVVLGHEAVLHAESLSCDLLWHWGAGRHVADDRSSAPRATRNAFGRPIVVHPAASAHEALCASYAAASAGLRVAAFLPPFGEGDALQGLAVAARSGVALVAHATARGRAELGAIDALGLTVLYAESGQHAVDLTLVARRVAEAWLCPVVVAIDGAETGQALSRVELPEPELVQRYLGPTEATRDCERPTEALLFGRERRAVPRLLDPDRPATIGALSSGADLAAETAGAIAFFERPSADALDEAMRALSERTGRPLETVAATDAGARHVVVAQGGDVELARTVAARLREGRRDVGVIAVHALGDGVIDRLTERLGRAEAVTVLDRGGSLATTVDRARGASTRLVIAPHCGDLRARDVAHCFANMARGADAAPVLHLGLDAAGGRSEFPKRQVLLQAMERSFPGLWDGAVSAPFFEARPSDARTVALVGEPAWVEELALPRLAEALEARVGHHIRARFSHDERGLARALVTVSPTTAVEPGAEPTVDVVAIGADDRLADLGEPPRLAERAVVVLSTASGPEAVGARLPPAWRVAASTGGRSCVCNGPDVEAIVDAVVAIVEGRGAAGLGVAVSAPTDEPTEHHVPMSVRRIGDTGAAFDSVQRFWGQVVQPRLEGAEAPFPDPGSTIGAMPPATSSFQPARNARSRTPRIDPERCTACGRCWVSCPDAAIGATALPVPALLSGIAGRVDGGATDGPWATLGRAHKQIGGRLASELDRGDRRAIRSTDYLEASEWALDKMGARGPEREALAGCADAVAARLDRLWVAVTPALFRDPHRRSKGSGDVVVLAVDPQGCQGCGICEHECPEDAIVAVPLTPQARREQAARWSDWEHLPDTSGPTIERAMQDERVGPLAAVLMSRTCLTSLTGGDGAEAGSGERVAARQVLATVESERQRSALKHVAELDELLARLRAAAEAAMTRDVSAEDLAALRDAVHDVDPRAGKLADLIGRLEDAGTAARVDVAALERLVSAASDLEQLRDRLRSGPTGMGRARYGVVLSGALSRRWAARFPSNPFAAPALVDPRGSGVTMALGLASAWAAARVTDARLARGARLLLEAPADVDARLDALEELTYAQLTDEERGCTPPVLLFTGLPELAARGFSDLSHALTSGLPIKVVLLDDHDVDGRVADPLLMALAHRDAHALSSSIAHPSHLFGGLASALAHRGPAVVHLHAPSPLHHGFGTHATIERAARAVELGVHPLVEYDPNLPGVFGARLRVTDVGSPDAAPADPGDPDAAAWLDGERRFATLADAERARFARGRAELFALLREIAGVTTPFTETVRQQIEAEIGATHAAELAARGAELERALAEAGDRFRHEQAQALRDRLLELAGYPTAGGGGPP